MDTSKYSLALKFLRTYSKPFTLKEMKKVLNAIGISATSEETLHFIQENPNVLELSNGKFLTRSAAFTGEIFSIKPTHAEIEQKTIVIGHRCVPFVETDRIACTLDFFINGKKIPKRVGEFDSDDAIDMFMLYGEEYAPQYIASDPANQALGLAGQDYELPNRVMLTGLDLEFLSRKAGFKKGSRLLCCVSDWAAGNINVMVLPSDEKSFDKGEIGEHRILWFSRLEEKLRESFQKHGPLGSIEDQLTYAFFENRHLLCVPYCGSVEELMQKTVTLGYEHYGVETRIWNKNQEVPPFGDWNIKNIGASEKLKKEISFEEYTFLNIPDMVYDQLIMDNLYNKEEDVIKKVISFFTEDETDFGGQFKELVALKLEKRVECLSREYNWFRDQSVGQLRHRILELYGDVSSLIRKLDYLGEKVVGFPSQEVVILSQLHSHILRMIDTIACDPAIEDSIEVFNLSIDGMEWNFEDIRGVLEDALQEEKKFGFKLIRK